MILVLAVAMRRVAASETATPSEPGIAREVEVTPVCRAPDDFGSTPWRSPPPRCRDQAAPPSQRPMFMTSVDFAHQRPAHPRRAARAPPPWSGSLDCPPLPPRADREGEPRPKLVVERRATWVGSILPSTLSAACIRSIASSSRPSDRSEAPLKRASAPPQWSRAAAAWAPAARRTAQRGPGANARSAISPAASRGGGGGGGGLGGGGSGGKLRPQFVVLQLERV